MTQEQEEIIKLLQKEAVGKSKAITADEIYVQLTNQGQTLFQGRTQEQIRDLIRNLVNSQDALIGSTSTGYYIISNSSEAQDTINNLKGRSSKIDQRADNLKNLWNKKNPNDNI